MLTPKKRRTNLELPESVYEQFGYLMEYDLEVRNAYMRLLRDEGWTLQSIADAVGDITRERARQCIEMVSADDARSIVRSARRKDSRLTFEIPDVPLLPEKVLKPKIFVDPKPETLKRLKELQPYASQVRFATTKYREEAEEYVALLWHAHTKEGVSVYRLAQLMEVTHAALATRFVRYGYRGTEGLSGSYTPIKHRAR